MSTRNHRERARQTSARERLAQQDHIGANTLVFTTEHLARACQTLLHINGQHPTPDKGTHRLDLVTDKQNVPLRTQLANLAEIPRGRNDDPFHAA